MKFISNGFLAGIALMMFFIPAAPCAATVEWEIRSTLNLDQEPIDSAVSVNGKWIFILGNQGDLSIYSGSGKLKEKISLGKHINQIKPGPRDDVLLLTSQKRKTVQVLFLDFIQHIDISGSPFKGPQNAPVVIAVFSEFQ